MKRISMIALMMSLLLALTAFVGCAAPEAAPEEVPVVDPVAGNEPAAAPEGEGEAPAGEVTMSPKPTTLTLEMEEVPFLIDNQSGIHYSTDMVQKLEVLKGETWEVVNPASEAVTMNLIAVPSGGMTQISVFLKGYYENLEHGTYRLTKTLVSDAGDAIQVSAEFDLF